jgi:hypothetical protein
MTASATISQAQMGGAGLHAFQGIAREWALTPKEQLALLAVPETTYRRWKTTALEGQGRAHGPRLLRASGLHPGHL